MIQNQLTHAGVRTDDVLLDVASLRKSLTTHVALKRLFERVNHDVSHQVTGLRECATTELTLICLFPGVQDHVRLQVSEHLESLAAFPAVK